MTTETIQIANTDWELNKYQTMTQIMQANKAAGYNWFSPDTMKWWNSKIEFPRPFWGFMFVTSESLFQDRLYSIRACCKDGSIDTLVSQIDNRIKAHTLTLSIGNELKTLGWSPTLADH
jgi:hypothetical protein